MRNMTAVACLTALAALGFLAGCGGDEEFPVGVYESVADINNLGPLTVAYEGDGTLTMEQQGEEVAEGTYAVDGDQITLSDGYCDNWDQETAVYTWEWDGSTLTMSTEGDKCQPRVDAVAEMTPVE